LQDYGTSNLNRRSNLTVFGSIQAPAKIVIAPNVIIHSGAPYDITVGEDIYGDNGTARGLFAPSGAACGSGGIYCTPYGNFSTNYVTGVLNGTAIPGNLVPRNYLTMPGIVSVNMRIYRVFGLGAKKGRGAAAGADGGPGGGFGGPGGGFGGPGGGGGRGGGGMSMGPRGGGGGRGGGIGGSSDRRFSLTVSANFSNALNHFNPAGYDGVLTSTQFGQATSVNTGFGGGGPGGGGPGGGGGTANNRRIDLGLRLNF
jgi:hypothetical protein